MSGISKEIEIDASVERAWEVLGDEFTQVCAWASGVTHSSGDNSIRTCQTSIGPIEETVTRFDPVRKGVSYTAKANKMPFFVTHLGNNWDLESLGKNRSKLKMRMEMKLIPPFNIFPGPLMRIKMSKLLDETLEEFKYYVETRKPHPRKTKQNGSSQ